MMKRSALFLILVVYVSLTNAVLFAPVFFDFFHGSLTGALHESQIRLLLENINQVSLWISGNVPQTPEQLTNTINPILESLSSAIPSNEEVAKTLEEVTLKSKLVVDDLAGKVNVDQLKDTVAVKLSDAVSQLKTTVVDSSPKLEIPSQETLKGLFQKEVVERTANTIDFLSRSPLAKNTQQFLSDLQTLPQRPFKMPVNIKAPIDIKIETNIGEKLAQGFNTWLDANPKLKLSASEYAADYYNNEFLPKYEDTVAFLGRSPLAQSVRNFASTPSSVVAGSIASAVAEKTSPLSEGLVLLAERAVTKFIADPVSSTYNSLTAISAEAIKSLSDEITDYATSTATQASIDNALSLISPDVIAQSLPPLPEVKIDLSSDEIARKAGEVLSVSAVAIGKASSTFSEQLGEKLGILTDNTVNAFSVFTSSIAKVTEDASSVLPQRSAVLIKQSQEQLVEQSETLATSLTQVVDQVSSITAKSIPTLLEDTVEKVKTWRLFPDESHWETGYWETTTKSLVSFTKDLVNKETVRAEVLNQVQETLAKAGDRFNAQTVQAFQKAGLEDLGKSLQEISSTASQAAVALSKEAKTLIEDSSHYVDEFIKTGQDL